MKSLISFLVLAMLCSAPVSAQDVSLFIAGVNLKLGMSKSAIIGRFQKPYDVIQTVGKADELIIREQHTNGGLEIVGLLWFKDDRLTRASKTWLNEDSDLKSSELTDVLYSVLEQMEQRGETNPTVTVFTSKKPNYKSQTIYLRYAKRAIEISTTTSSRIGNLVQISEEIGPIR